MKIIKREPEANLIEVLTDMQDALQGWYAVAFHFSHLLEHYKSEYQIKITLNLLNDLLSGRDGAIYLCEDATIYVVVNGVSKPILDKMVFQLRYLFMDDPLAYTAEGDENPGFCDVFPLDEHYEIFLSMVKKRLVQHVRQSKANAGTDEHRSPTVEELKEALTDEPIEYTYFDARSLVKLVRDLRGIDISPAIRKQPVCACIPDTSVRTVFNEMYVNIAALKELLHTHVDILSNRWLFKYLTEVLDEKMLEMMQNDQDTHLSGPVSINVNTATLLSNHFAAFDSMIKANTKVSVVMELQLADVFIDMSAFLTAKNIAQKLGYRVCLDGVTDLSFPQIDRRQLGFDLIKLQWNADTDTDLKSQRNRELAEAIRRCGTNRVILTRCDNDKAVRYGQSLGITLFQGRHLDSIVNPKASIIN
jgi:EAL domain-containing protein (putative c-di-GMP-specific phosphodiesterase class I)